MTDNSPETAPDVLGEQPDPVSDTVDATTPAEAVVEEPAAEQEAVEEVQPAEQDEPEPKVEEEPEAAPEEVNGQAAEDLGTKRKLEEDDQEVPEAKKMNTGMDGQPMDVEVRRMPPAVGAVEGSLSKSRKLTGNNSTC